MQTKTYARAEIVAMDATALRLAVAEHVMGWTWKNAGSGVKWLVNEKGIIGAAIFKKRISFTPHMPELPADEARAALIAVSEAANG